MGFKHPEFLYGLFAVLIPIIIHLFNFRRYKKLYFSNIEFLKNITTETRKQNKIKHFIVLLLRIMAIVFIVLAFAGPEWGKTGKQQLNTGENIRAIYIDNSFSMMAEGVNGQLFHEGISGSRELIAQSTRDTRFVLLDNEGANGRNTVNKEAIKSKLAQVSISPAFRPLSSVIQNGLNLAREKENSQYELFLYSDFQKNAFDAAFFPADSIGNYYFIPLKQSRNRNIYIDSCWITTPVLVPGKHAQLMIRLRNVSGEDYEKVPLTLKIDDQQKAVAGVNLKAQSTETIKMSFSMGKAGWHTGLIEIEDYPITFDDQFYFTYDVEQNLNVLEIHNENGSADLQLFYQSDSVFQFERMNHHQIDYNKFNAFKLIILNSIPSYSSGLIQQLTAYIDRGGIVFFIPQEESDLSEENKFLQKMQAGKILALDTAKSRVVRIKRNQELFRESISNIPKNADLPTVNKHYRFSFPVHSGLESLVSLLNGDDFLLKKNMGKGQLFLLAVPLDKNYSNFSSHALFVPVMYGVALIDGIVDRLFYTLKKDEVISTDLATTPSEANAFSMQLSSSDYSFIPEQQMINGELRMQFRHDNLKTDGFYSLVLNDSSWRIFAFNFDRDESVTVFYSPQEIREKLSSSGLVNYQVLNALDHAQSNVINSLQTESRIWMLFIIFALLMLLLEVILLRFWK